MPVTISTMTRWPGISGLPFTLAFALLAYSLRAVDASGALAGAAVALVLYWFAGPGAFVLLMIVFLLTWIATRLRYAHKEKLGRAERRGGRSGAQVFANLGAAALCALPMPLGALGPVLRVALVAAVAEAAADTVSSECGIAFSDRVRLITTWRAVSPGTDGGISVPGTLAGAIAALLVALAGLAVKLISSDMAPFAAGAAVLGMFFDSVLGATLERRRIIGNNIVNLLGTSFAALSGLAAALLVQ